MKKKIVALLLMAMMAVSVMACGENKQTDNGDNEQNVSDDADTKDNASDKTVEEKKSEGTMLFDVPSGFTYNEEDSMYYSDDEGEMANIIYYTVENDGSFDQVTKEAMLTALQQSLGSDITLEMPVWESLTVSGYDALHYQIAYTYMGIGVVQDQLVVNGTDNFHYLTFTRAASEDYDAAYTECIKSARFE